MCRSLPAHANLRQLERHEPSTADVQGDIVEQINATTRLVLSGRILPASNRRLLRAFGVHLAAQLERQQLVIFFRVSLGCWRGGRHTSSIDFRWSASNSRTIGTTLLP